MALIYHGTGLERGIAIANCGAILSNLEQKIMWLEHIRKKDPENFKKKFRGQSKKEIAEGILKPLYNKGELHARVECFSVATKLIYALPYAATHDNNRKGGIVLGIDIDEKDFKKFSKHYGNDDILFIPGKLSLKNLKEIHVSRIAKIYLDKIKKSFEKYSPKYFYFF